MRSRQEFDETRCNIRIGLTRTILPAVHEKLETYLAAFRMHRFDALKQL